MTCNCNREKVAPPENWWGRFCLYERAANARFLRSTSRRNCRAITRVTDAREAYGPRYSLGGSNWRPKYQPRLRSSTV